MTQKEFYDTIQITDNKQIVVKSVTDNGTENKALNQKGFFDKATFVNGALKIVKR